MPANMATAALARRNLYFRNGKLQTSVPGPSRNATLALDCPVIPSVLVQAMVLEQTGLQERAGKPAVLMRIKP